MDFGVKVMFTEFPLPALEIFSPGCPFQAISYFGIARRGRLFGASGPADTKPGQVLVEQMTYFFWNKELELPSIT